MILPLLLAAAIAAPPPSRAPEMYDADTRAWWQATETLAGDAMEGRDTGSPGYDRAARIVADRFAAAGLRPLGDNGGWFQTLRLTDVTVALPGSRLAVGAKPLRLLHDITLRPSPRMPRTVDAPLAFRGYCAPGALGDVRGKVVLCFGWRRAGLTTADQRQAAVEAAGAAGVLTIADPGFTVEPMNWPVAYARSVAPAGAPAPRGDTLLVGTVNPQALPAFVGDAAAVRRRS